MNVNRGMILATLAGLVGAVVWAAISYLASVEISWIALGIGGIVGFGMALGAGGGNKVLGFIAAVITVVSISAGKYAAVQLLIYNQFGTVDSATADAVAELENDNVAISYIADEIVVEQMEANAQLEWPEVVDPNALVSAANYPPGVWDQADVRWLKMDAAERQAFRDRTAANTREQLEAAFDQVSRDVFVASFGFMDLLFFGLAVATAYQIAAGGLATQDETQDDTLPDGTPVDGAPPSQESVAGHQPTDADPPQPENQLPPGQAHASPPPPPPENPPPA